MKRTLSIILATLLCFSAVGCSGGEKPQDDTIHSGSGVVAFTSSSSEEVQPPAQAESPAAAESSVEAEQPTASEAPTPAPSPAPSPSVPVATRPGVDEVRSVWISYLELQGLMTGNSSSQFRSEIADVFKTGADFGLNTVVLQVRPFADAIYPSEIFPQSYLFTGKEGHVGEAPYDALAIAIEEARKCGLRLEAWINPYRIRNSASRDLSSDNPAEAMLESGDAVKMGEVITYNPASTKAQELIVNGVVEIVKNYDVDAIHFDDYFYPTTDAAFDKDDYSAYKSSGGTKSLAAWRRSNVTALIRKVHDAIEATKPSVLFGISPQGNMQNNLNAQFVDVEEIVKAGLVDYICPQMYFGFQNSGCPYGSTIKDFNMMTRGTDVKVYVGLATYKFGTADSWAGEGKNEWIGTTDILKRQVEAARELSCYGGFVLYRYDSTFRHKSFFSGYPSVWPQVESELSNLKMLL
ncbi:MAG: family 10 glycosylhydrolase [Angelakisella sp.]